MSQILGLGLALEYHPTTLSIVLYGTAYKEQVFKFFENKGNQYSGFES